MWKKALICLLGLLGLMGCREAKTTYTAIPSTGHVLQREMSVWVDKNFSDEDKLDIQKSLEEWNYVLNGYQKFDVVSWNFDLGDNDLRMIQERRGIMILRIESSSGFMPGDDPGFVTVAWTNRIGGNKIFVVRDRIHNMKRFHSAVLHELGHVEGAPDFDGEGSLMDGVYQKSNPTCVDKRSAEAVALYQGIPFEGMNYCFFSD
jgi:hypothetical protein